MIEGLKEAAKDAGSEIKDGIKEAAAKRFGGALPAYIATSWIAFNWSNIALLFMSKVPVEQRIQAIIGQENLYREYLVYPIIMGIILAFATPVAEYFIRLKTSKYDVGARRAEQAAEQEFTEKLNKKAEDILIRESRITELKREKASLTRDNMALVEKSDELINNIRNGYDSIVSIILRSNYLTAKINEIKDTENLSQEKIKQILEKTFTTQEILNAYKRNAEIQAKNGPTAANYLLEGNPKPLEANDNLVKELLAVTGVIKVSDAAKQKYRETQ